MTCGFKQDDGLAIPLPASLADVLHLRAGDQIELTVSEDGLLGLARKPTRDELVKSLRSFRGLLPANFKFDRDEANAR